MAFNLWKAAGGVLKGTFDIGWGVGEFAVDTVKAGGHLLTGDADQAASTLFQSIQEDLLGQTLQGAFGPEGVIGSLINILPEEGPLGFIRTKGRAVIEPTFKYWDWTMQNVVDRPLGTFATILNVGFKDGLGKAFDASTWAAAWEINDKRTFGQSVAALAAMIDPFDDDEYDEIQDDPMFNLLSGTVDFFQEFLDPVGLALGGSVNLIRGKTVIGKFDKAGEFQGVGRKNYDEVGGLIQPEKVYTPGGGIFRRGLRTDDRLTDAQKNARNMVAKRFVAQRAESVFKSKRWQALEKEWDTLEKVLTREEATYGYAQGINKMLDTKASQKLINQRYAVLRDVAGTRGIKLNDKAAYAIAKGASKEARRMTARFMMGDMSVLADAGAAAEKARALLDDSDFFGKVAQYDLLKAQYDEALESGSGTVSFTKAKQRIDDLGREISEKSETLNKVDWETMFDGYLGFLESRGRKVVDINGNPTTQWENIFDGNPHLESLQQLTVEKILALDSLSPEDLLRLSEQGVSGTSSFTKIWSDPFGAHYSKRVRAMEAREKATGVGQEFFEEVYTSPSVITPLGVRRFRVGTQRLPQSLIEFGSDKATIMWERMLGQASEVRIGGERIVGVEEINDLLGEWESFSSSPVDSQVRRRKLYVETMARLTGRADSLLAKNNIALEGGTLAEQLANAKTIKDKAILKPKKNVEGGRESRKATSTSESRGTYQFFDDVAGETVTVTLPMTPSMLKAAEILPRWDLINMQLKRVSREANRKGGNVSQRVLQKTEDGFRLVLGKGSSAASKTMRIWRPSVLLTPKWPMRVQIDETMRRAADLGVLTEIRNFAKGFSDMRDAQMTKGVNMRVEDVSDLIVLNAKEKLGLADDAADPNLGDALRTLEEEGISVDDVMNQHATDVVNGIRKSDKFVPGPLKGTQVGDKIGTMPSYFLGKGSLIRFGVGSLLIGLPAGLLMAGAYGARRYQRIHKLAQKQAAESVADALVAESRKLFVESLGPDAPPGMVQQAEQMLSRGEGIRDALYVIQDDVYGVVPEGIELEKIVDNVEKAHALLNKIGLANQTIYGATIRNAYGDNNDFREMISSEVSSSKAVSSILRGVREGQERQLLKYFDADWERWDFLSDDTASFVRNFNSTMNRYSDFGGKYSDFYKAIFDDQIDHATKVERLKNIIKNDEDLADRLSTFNSELMLNDPKTFDQYVNDLVKEYDELLPPGLLPDLRAKMSKGEPVVWKDVERGLLREERRLAKAQERDAITDVEYLVGQVREEHPSFARSVGPNERSIDPSRDAYTGAVGKMVNDMYETLGQMPADHLSRNPYFKTKYDREVARRLALLTDENGRVNLSQNALNAIEEEARKSALRETRDLLYDLAEETRIAEIVTFIMPFFNAWQEVIGRWAKLSVENPYFVAKAAKLYSAEWDAEFLGINEVSSYDEASVANKEEELGRSLTDSELKEFETGNYLVWRLPEPIKEAIPESLTPGPLGEILREQDIRFNKEGLASMLQSTTPGFGPLVSIPVNEMLLKNPSLEESVKFMFPFGPPEGSFTNRLVQGFLPSWQQNVVNRWMDTPTKERMVQYFAQQLYVQAADNGMPVNLGDEADVARWLRAAEDRANSFFLFRAAQGLFVPTSTTAISPYSELMNEYRKLRTRHGEKEADSIFLESYGEDLFGLTARMTRLNDGVAASVESEKGYMANQELVQQFPEIGAWITGSIGPADEKYSFSQAVYRRQTQMDASELAPGVKRRERLSPLETMAATDIKLGWMKYTEMNDGIRSYQSERESLGLSYSLNSTEMAPTAAAKRNAIERIKKEHPAWAAEFVSGQKEQRIVKVVEGFMHVFENPDLYEGLMVKPSTELILHYFKIRGGVEQELIRRFSEENGSLSLEANSNSDLKLFWENNKEFMGQMPGFSEIYDRFFENDSIPKQSFVSLVKV